MDRPALDMSSRRLFPNNPLLELIRQLISLLILFVSFVLAAFLTIETREVIRPVNPYHLFLVDLYEQTDDWVLIHTIEEELSRIRLSSPLNERFRDVIWEKYLQSPEQYRTILRRDAIELGINDRDGEYRTILINRSDHIIERSLGVQSYDILLIEEERRRRDLTHLLSSIRSAAQNASVIIKGENESRESLVKRLREANKSEEEIEQELSKRRILLNEPELESISHLAELSRDLIAYDDTLFQLMAPRYKLFVYDSFQRVYNDSLVDLATIILADDGEDAYLRLVAADYLSVQGDAKSLVEEIHRIVERQGARERGRTSGPEGFRAAVFEAELLRILRRAILRSGQ